MGTENMENLNIVQLFVAIQGEGGQHKNRISGRTND